MILRGAKNAEFWLVDPVLRVQSDSCGRVLEILLSAG